MDEAKKALVYLRGSNYAFEVELNEMAACIEREKIVTSGESFKKKLKRLLNSFFRSVSVSRYGLLN